MSLETFLLCAVSIGAVGHFLWRVANVLEDWADSLLHRPDMRITVDVDGLPASPAPCACHARDLANEVA